MLASLDDAPLDDPRLVYEPKYDGIRAIVEIAPKGETRLWSRLGNEKTRQFPEIAAALRQWARARKQPLILDGEIVALDPSGEPSGFQNLQGRIHVLDPAAATRPSRRSRASSASDPSSPSSPSTALIAFDILRDGATDYRGRPLTERRAALERLFADTGSPLLRISRQSRGDGQALFDEAMQRGWEGSPSRRPRCTSPGSARPTGRS